MKLCYRCNEYKDIGEFYVNNARKDNLDFMCKECRKKDNSKNHNREKPYSTTRAMDLLRENNIPATTGYAVGLPWIDVAAFGYIPIEAKSAIKRKKAFSFGFTDNQIIGKTDAFLFLIARDGEKENVFIIPPGVEVERKIYITINPKRGNGRIGKWSWVLKYDGRYDLIKERVISDCLSNMLVEDDHE